MNSTANLIAHFPGSNSLSSTQRASSLGSTIRAPSQGYSLMSRSPSISTLSTSLSRSPSLSSLNSEEVIRGGVPNMNSLFSTTLKPNNSFLHGHYAANLLLGASNTLSGGIKSAWSASQELKANQVHSNNLTTHGVSLAPAIATIDQNNFNRINSASAGATIGSLFGPLGAAAGFAIGNAVASKSSLPANISTPSGTVSANDDVLASSHSSGPRDSSPILDE